MKALRDLCVIAAIFAMALAYFAGQVGVSSPYVGVMAMLTPLGLAGVAQPQFLLRLPAWARQQRPWERDGRLYARLGVPAFGALLRRTPLRNLNRLVYLVGGADPAVVVARLESAEASHLLAATVLVPWIVYACVRSSWVAVAWLLAVQFGVNVFPILHLRAARGRLTRILARSHTGRPSMTVR